MTGCLHIVLAMKPVGSGFAENCLRHGCGALNLDECRIGTEERFNEPTRKSETVAMGSFANCEGQGTYCHGRWPANFIHDGSEKVIATFPDGAKAKPRREGKRGGSGFGFFDDEKSAQSGGVWPEDFGGSASRFFKQVDELELGDTDEQSDNK